MHTPTNFLSLSLSLMVKTYNKIVQVLLCVNAVNFFFHSLFRSPYSSSIHPSIKHSFFHLLSFYICLSTAHISSHVLFCPSLLSTSRPYLPPFSPFCSRCTFVWPGRTLAWSFLSPMSTPPPMILKAHPLPSKRKPPSASCQIF